MTAHETTDAGCLKECEFFVASKHFLTLETTAVRIKGLSCGDIGLFEDESFWGFPSWKAVHIPTGLRLLDPFTSYPDRERALAKAREVLLVPGVIEANLEKYMDCEDYRAFLRSRSGQMEMTEEEDG